MVKAKTIGKRCLFLGLIMLLIYLLTLWTGILTMYTTPSPLANWVKIIGLLAFYLGVPLMIVGLILYFVGKSKEA